ncbi:MAG: hypothetical protein IIB00_07000 [candidate division Zixibacteria bacterium]|nr:hypothetical protein [candidate division Zixibacteria bacterium]
MGIFNRIKEYFEVDDRVRNIPVNVVPRGESRVVDQPTIIVNDETSKESPSSGERPPIVFSNG